MMQRTILAVSLLCIISSSTALMPRRCFWNAKEKKLKCQMALLDRFLKHMELTSDTESLIFTNNKLVNAAMVKTKIQGLSELKVLDISYNKFKTNMADIVEANTKLEEFLARDNRIRAISEKAFQNNPMLKRVDLSNNKLTSLPRQLFAKNPRLQSVEFWANDITSIPVELFRNNKDVEVINLSWNKLYDIPERIFRGLNRLKKVMLWKNQLTCLYSTMFLDNVNLEAVHVAINQIKKVPDSIFKNNARLQDVRLWSNKLECIPKTTFDNNAKLEYVNMLIGNEGLDYDLKQRFSNRGSLSIGRLNQQLHKFGTDSCTAPPCEWNPETETMDCSHRGLTDISVLTEVCEKVRNLNLNGNKLNDPEQLVPVMTQMEELRNLEIRDNEMEGELNPTTFKSNLELSDVDFSKNRIKNIPKQLFEANTILKKVNLDDNEIEELPEDLMINNPELTEFDMSRNKLRGLPKDMFTRNQLLTTLKLSKNRISKIDSDSFRNNNKLRELDLADNLLDGELDSSSFEHAPDLEKVKLEGNRIKNLTRTEIGREQKRMSELVLSNNRLDEFPLTLVEKRPMLKKLILDHNKISVIPVEGLHKNTELQEIDMSYNQLTDMHIDTFEKNTKLEILKVNNNALTKLEKGLLRNNRNLRFFSANGNKIYYISEYFFNDMPQLEEVLLSDNALTVVPKNLFFSCDNLRLVSMTKNKLDDLEYAVFEFNPNLEHVCLHGNDLSKLPEPDIIDGPGKWVEEDDNEDGSKGPKDHEKTDKPPVVIQESNQRNYFGKTAVRQLLNILREKKVEKEGEGIFLAPPPGLRSS